MPFYPPPPGFYPPRQAWTPAQLGGVNWWINSENLLKVPGAPPQVISFYDLIGSNDTHAPTPPDRPYYYASVQNGLPGALFNGTLNYMTMAATGSTWLAIAVKNVAAADLAGLIGILNTDTGVRFRTTPAWEASGGTFGIYRQPTTPAADGFQYIEITETAATADSLFVYFVAGLRFLSGYLLEVVGATATPSAADLALVRNYFSTRYGATL